CNNRLGALQVPPNAFDGFCLGGVFRSSGYCTDFCKLSIGGTSNEGTGWQVVGYLSRLKEEMVAGRGSNSPCQTQTEVPFYSAVNVRLSFLTIRPRSLRLSAGGSVWSCGWW